MKRFKKQNKQIRDFFGGRAVCFVDIETTGGAAQRDHIIEISMARVDKKEESLYTTLVDPGVRVPPFITGLTGITTEMVKGQPKLIEVMPEVTSMMENAIIIAHNAPFDIGFIGTNLAKQTSQSFCARYLCTVQLARKCLPQLANHSLSTVLDHYGISTKGAHRAEADCLNMLQAFSHMLDRFPEIAIHSLEDLVSMKQLKLKSFTADGVGLPPKPCKL